MTTLAGVFFSLISLFGLVKCKTKRTFRKIVLVAFSVFLVLMQVLFMNSIVQVAGDEFIALSGIISGVILILAFQKNAPE